MLHRLPSAKELYSWLLITTEDQKRRARGLWESSMLFRDLLRSRHEALLLGIQKSPYHHLSSVAELPLPRGWYIWPLSVCITPCDLKNIEVEQVLLHLTEVGLDKWLLNQDKIKETSRWTDILDEEEKY